MAVQIQIRRDTLSNWTTHNPILAIGELAYVTDTDAFKVGDGTTVFNSLAYSNVGQTGPTGPIGPTGPTGPAFKGVSIRADKNIIQYDLNGSNPSPSGTVTLTAGSTEVTGSSTAFTSNFTEGDKIFLSSGTSLFMAKITFIDSDTKLQIDRVSTRAYSGVAVSKLSFIPDFLAVL